MAVFTQGIERYPGSDREQARFLRHRGHRWLTLREPARAEHWLYTTLRRMGRDEEAEAELARGL